MDKKYLDINEKLNVVYCIPFWLRDEQVKYSTNRIKSRISPNYDKRTEPIAVVCYGPSLNDTWEQIKNFKYIITCSGAHKFLIEKGIIPTWHCEVDPREHKVKLIGTPHKDVEYLIASTCHKAVFDHLEGFSIKLWHVFANEEEALRILPPNEWALTGGSSVGLRAMTIARFLGFTDLHIFGMDGNSGKSGKHASEHPNQPKDFVITTYNGKEFETTAAYLECAKQTWHELDQMPDVKATFYGDGLVQEMAKNYVPNHQDGSKSTIGINKPELISKEYIELNKNLHTDNLYYGVGGGRLAPTVIKLAESLKTTGICDYGCGKGYLAKALPFPIWEYDPAIPGKTESPRPADIVICSDVLEHIESDKLLFVLGDLCRCVKKIGYFVIHTGPAVKKYANGENAHLIQKDKVWWKKKLSKFFDVASIIESPPELHIVVAPKKHKKEKLLVASKFKSVKEKENE